MDRIHELETEQHAIMKDRDAKQKALLQQQQASVSDKKSLESSKYMTAVFYLSSVLISRV